MLAEGAVWFFESSARLLFYAFQVYISVLEFFSGFRILPDSDPFYFWGGDREWGDGENVMRSHPASKSGTKVACASFLQYFIAGGGGGDGGGRGEGGWNSKDFLYFMCSSAGSDLRTCRAVTQNG